MDLNEYQRLAMRTKNRGEIGGIPDLAVAGLGIAGEAGEVADEIKKVLGHGKAMDVEKLKKELGDVLWYCASVAVYIVTTLSEVAELNVAKLKARYPNGFNTGDSVAKADEKTANHADTTVGDGTTTADWLRHMAEREDRGCITVGHIDKVKAVAEAEESAKVPGKSFEFKSVQVWPKLSSN
jgi:NTP pyrophosphatase (non-canonical NTP hydrolase)